MDSAGALIALRTHPEVTSSLTLLARTGGMAALAVLLTSLLSLASVGHIPPSPDGREPEGGGNVISLSSWLLYVHLRVRYE